MLKTWELFEKSPHVPKNFMFLFLNINALAKIQNHKVFCGAFLQKSDPPEAGFKLIQPSG
jgi:hypothetical protein